LVLEKAGEKPFLGRVQDGAAMQRRFHDKFNMSARHALSTSADIFAESAAIEVCQKVLALMTARTGNWVLPFI